MMQGKNKQGKRTEGVPLANETSMLSDLNLESKQARRNLMITHMLLVLVTVELCYWRAEYEYDSLVAVSMLHACNCQKH